MPLFDTSALVPLFDAAHIHHHEAKARFDDADQVILHPSVITEFTTVVRRAAKDHGRDGNREARQALQSLLRQPRVAIRAEMDYDRVVETYLATPRMSFTDAVVAHGATSLDKAPPVTFDGALGQPSTPR